MLINYQRYSVNEKDKGTSALLKNIYISYLSKQQIFNPNHKMHKLYRWHILVINVCWLERIYKI